MGLLVAVVFVLSGVVNPAPSADVELVIDCESEIVTVRSVRAGKSSGSLRSITVKAPLAITTLGLQPRTPEYVLDPTNGTFATDIYEIEASAGSGNKQVVEVFSIDEDRNGTYDVCES